jgi:serine/threonine protein kinase
LRAIGAGGMGEVFRARDTRLNRDVAIKILPEAFAQDAERVARFSREAQTLAALNHQHIAQIYGVEEGRDGAAGSTIRALVMELVEGETLADRISRGRLSIDEAIPIARQIAQALEAAHDAGVIHRDLKPANIKFRPDGTVKVLDFGLAKAVEPGATGATGATSAVTSPAMTQAGLILGTAAYMAPEQARGRPVDRRADIFAFGCVFYEMLTGRRAFDGEDVADVLGAVLKTEPDWSLLPSDVPVDIRRLLRACLAKDPKSRRGTAADVRIDLDDAMSSEASAAARPISRGPSSLLWVAAGAALASIAFASMWYFRPQPTAPVMRFNLPLPPGVGLSPQPWAEVSPDGKHVAFVAGESVRSQQVWIRSLQDESARALTGTEGASAPFWSPDSGFIGFIAGRQLKRISTAGGRPQTLAAVPFQAGTGTWNAADLILFSGQESGGIYRVPAVGGAEPSRVTTLNSTRGELAHVTPRFLPDGRRFLYSIWSTIPEHAGVYLASLDSTETVKVLDSASKAQYVPIGMLLFVRNRTLFAQPFDLERTRLTGAPALLADAIYESVVAGFSGFSASDTGVLVLRNVANHASGFDLSWYDRSGQQVSHVAVGTFQGLDVSPRGTQLASHRHEGASQGDVWINDLERGTESRFTFETSADNQSPIWSPDGKVIAFSGLRNGKWGLYRKAADGAGTEELLYESETPVIPMTWSPDGGTLVFVNLHPQTNHDLWSLPLGGARQPAPIVRTPQSDSHAQISPDGRWMSYRSGAELYVQRYPIGERRYMVARGLIARWRADGRELFFSEGGEMWAVSVEAGDESLKLGTPTKLFALQWAQPPHQGANLSYFTYAVSGDGQRFLFPRPLPDRDESTPALKIVLNWQEELKRRLVPQ